ncbi:MAG TPA: RHS repeat-associated core domain-containing protein, partial [bacterium]|nr:RHS repeat-associated core domain-containing protein [bacterium]
MESKIDSNGQSMFYLRDGLGSTLAIVDDRGKVIRDYSYSGYGESLSGQDEVNAYRFEGGVGGREDDDTGLVYFWNRWYDPSVGRWVNEDPIRQAGGVNLYGYVANNPAIGTDSVGLYTVNVGVSIGFSIGTWVVSGSFGIVA